MNEPQEKTPEDLLLVISLPRSEVRAKANSPAALHACGANCPSQERAISPAVRTTFYLAPEVVQFCLRRKVPAPAQS